MLDAKPDVHLGYRGGSGGFLLLHLLLYSGDYHVSFEDGLTFDDAVNRQWHITDTLCWKNSEVWPDRHETMLDRSSLPRIFYYCNPDISEYFLPQKYIVNSYQRCKDQSWPEVEDFESYIKLPKHIRDECEIQHGLAPLVQRYVKHKKFVWLYTDIDSQQELAYYKKAHWYCQQPEKPKQVRSEYGIYNNTPVEIEAVPFLQRCDIVLYLQDLIRNPSTLIDLGLIESVNVRQIQLIEKWLSLHPWELLKKINLYDSATTSQ
jgi:hypothetical protein